MVMQKLIKYLFVINNGSGASSTTSWDAIISDFFRDKDDTFQLYNLPAHFETKQIKDHILLIKPAYVIAVGGDGTVTMLANIVAQTNIPLGILPGGSANGMAKELGIPVLPDDALKIIVAAYLKEIDLIKINQKKYCLHLSDLGLNAHLIKHFDEGKTRGKLGYALVLLKTLWHKEKMEVIIRTNETSIRRSAFMVALANASKYGTGAVINPEGKLDDGLFEVIIVKKLSVGPLLKMLLKPGLFNSTKIEIVSCTSVEINTKSKVHFQIDGEYQGRTKHLTAEINKGAVKMIVPAN
jgi:diacylglycerol kinase (ATP)